MALGETLRRGRAGDPKKTALIVDEQAWSYEALDQMTDSVSRHLLMLGIRPGDRIALHFTNGPEMVIAYYACFKVGAVAVPLNVRLTGSEIVALLNQCGARLYLGQHDLFAAVQPLRHDLPRVERFYVSGSAAAVPEAEPFERLLTDNADPLPFPRVGASQTALILYTSGTTARPKGVTHTHATLEATIANYHEYAALTAADVVGVVPSMAHIFGLALLLFPTLAVGATAVVIPRFEPDLVLDAFERRRVTQCGALPVMYNALIHAPGAASRDLGALRFCLAGGDAVPTELQRRFEEKFGIALTEGCGMTEVIPYACNPAYGAKRAGSMGLPLPGVRLRLVDENGRDVPGGEVGEICVQSEASMVGYWEEPEATAATLRDGWLHTGDLGRIDTEGYYWFVGRKKEIIVRGGSNISPLEVEEVLYQHPAVREAGVVGVPDDRWGEVVAAFVALKPAASATEAELHAFLADRLATYKLPETITFLSDLPKGLTGKIHRKSLRESAMGGEGR